MLKFIFQKFRDFFQSYPKVDRDRGGGGAGRAIALPLFCGDLFSRAPVDMEKISVELLDFSKSHLDFSLKGERLEPVVFDESLRTIYAVLTEEWNVCLSELLRPDVRARIIGCKT